MLIKINSFESYLYLFYLNHTQWYCRKHKKYNGLKTDNKIYVSVVFLGGGALKIGPSMVYVLGCTIHRVKIEKNYLI